MNEIDMTEAAQQKVRALREDDGNPNLMLRVYVTGGGCSGFTYILGFDEKKSEDEEFTSNGIQVIMNKAHAIYLVGIEIDFQDGLQNRGFTFNNPNATESCGCGTSFSA